MKKIFKSILQKDIFLSENSYNFKKKFKSLDTLNLLLDVWKNISYKRKKQFFILFFLMIISGISELLALGSIIPFLTAIADANNLLKYSFINNLYNIFGLTNNNQLIIMTTILFLIMIYLSAIIRVINLLFNYRLTAVVGSELSIECYRKTLYQPYQTHIETNSSLIINTISKDVNITVNSLSKSLIIINSAIISISIFIGLLVVRPKLAFLLSGLFIFCYFLIANKNRIQIEKNSYVITFKSQERIKTLQEL